jgi:peptidyl-dipeptidase A
MPHPVLTLLAVFACSATLVARAASPSPTVEEARDFVDRVNTALLASSIENSRTVWVSSTYITDDTEILRSTANARAIAQRNQFIAESHRFDNLKLPPNLAREIMLLRNSTSSTPSRRPRPTFQYSFEPLWIR